MSATLEQRVADLESIVRLAPDVDTPITGLRRIALAIGISASSLRRWVSDIDDAQRHKLATLLRKNASGRWFTTKRLITKWRAATAVEPWGVPRG